MYLGWKTCLVAAAIISVLTCWITYKLHRLAGKWSFPDATRNGYSFVGTVVITAAVATAVVLPAILMLQMALELFLGL